MGALRIVLTLALMLAAPLAFHSRGFGRRLTGENVECQSLSGDLTKCFLESCAVVIATLIKAERLFVQIPELVDWFDADVRSANRALQ